MVPRVRDTFARNAGCRLGWTLFSDRVNLAAHFTAPGVGSCPIATSGQANHHSKVDCDRNGRARLLKKQPVQTLYDFSNQIVPRACFPDGIRVSNLLGVQID